MSSAIASSSGSNKHETIPIIGLMEWRGRAPSETYPKSGGHLLVISVSAGKTGWTNAREWRKPRPYSQRRNGGRKEPGWVVVLAVQSEPLSAAEFPGNREK